MRIQGSRWIQIQPGYGSRSITLVSEKNNSPVPIPEWQPPYSRESRGFPHRPAAASYWPRREPDTPDCPIGRSSGSRSSVPSREAGRHCDNHTQAPCSLKNLACKKKRVKIGATHQLYTGYNFGWNNVYGTVFPAELWFRIQWIRIQKHFKWLLIQSGSRVLMTKNWRKNCNLLMSKLQEKTSALKRGNPGLKK